MTRPKNVRAALEKDIEDLLKKLGSGRTELQTALESGVEVTDCVMCQWGLAVYSCTKSFVGSTGDPCRTWATRLFTLG